MSATEQLLSTFPQAVCAAIKETLPELRQCEPIAGKYSLEELKATGAPSPSVMVSTLGAKQGATFAGAAHSFALQMAAYVVCRDGLGAPRDVRAANICQALLTLIPAKRWGLKAFGEAFDVAMHCLVSSKVKTTGVSLWAVTWSQPVSFFARPAGPLGVALYVSQAPEIGAANEAEYSEIGGALDV